MGRSKLWRGLTAVFASLFAISIVLSAMADSRAGFLNGRLGTTNYITVQDGESDVDGYYFDSEFTSLEQVVNAKQELAVEIGREGAVLLKNNGALPLDKSSENVTLWGFNSSSPILGGMMGSTAVAAEGAGQKAYGIKEALAERGFTVNQDMIDFYADASMDQYRMQSMLFGQVSYGHALSVAFDTVYEAPDTYFVGEAPVSLYSDALTASADGSVAVVVISRDSSEAADYQPTMTCASPDDSFERPLALSENERAVIKLAKAHSTKLIVLVNSDSAMELEELKQDPDVDALMWVGAPGVYGFLGVADVLSGDANPSGSLPDTYAVNGTSSPAMANFGIYHYTNYSQAEGSPLSQPAYGDFYLVENEGIYTGYRYYETRYEDQILGSGNATDATGSTTGNAWSYADEVSYPFGYGMSYTTFEQKLDSVELAVGGAGRATVTVTNTGDKAGKCAVQLYVQAPYTAGGLEKAAIQLLAFGKTDILEPGASQTLDIDFDPTYMASYDENVVKADGTQGAWVLEQGDYYFAVGNGAHEALNNVLAKKTGSDEGLVRITENETINADNAVLWTLGETDVETYSKNVKNALQEADINKLIPDTVTYVTRADWTRGWETVSELTATDEMVTRLNNQASALTPNGGALNWGVDSGLTLIGMVETDAEGNFAGVRDINDPDWDRLVDQIPLDEAMHFIQEGSDDFDGMDSAGFPTTNCNDGPVGFAYDQVSSYTAHWAPSESGAPTYVAADDPYANYSMAVFPTEPVVAATFNQALVEREGELYGEDSLWSNTPGTLSPAINLHRTPYCARNHEYYSEDPMLTNLMAVAVCKGAVKKGLMMEVKHFAFNHQEMNRVGVSTFMTEQAGREGDLRAFQGACAGNWTKGVMSAYNRVGDVYTGGSRALQIDILRNEWGYTGWIVTDMAVPPEYMNWREAVYGGGCAVLTSTATFAQGQIGTMESHRDEILADEAFQRNMKDGIKYYLYTFAGSNAMNGITANTRRVYVRTWWQNAIRYTEIGLGVLTALCVILLFVTKRERGKA